MVNVQTAPSFEGADEASRVTVAVRVRPLRSETLAERYESSCLFATEGTNGTAEGPTVLTIVNPMTKEQTDFGFDRVFDDSHTQADVYSELVEDPLLTALDRSGDLTVVAYGQTGSGKTFTMLGESDGRQDELLTADSGVFLRVMQSLLLQRRYHEQTKHTLISVTAVELYNDNFMDLLAQSRAGKPSHRNAASSPTGAALGGGSSFTSFVETKDAGENLLLQNLRRMTIDSADSIRRCFEISHRNRSVAATGMNEVSSRSHALFFIDVFTQQKREDNREQPPDEEAAVEWLQSMLLQSGIGMSRRAVAAATAGGSSHPSNNFELHPLTHSRITLVDLAGSERVKRSGVIGKELQEAVFVNSSLSTLGLVVHALCARATNGSKHIPFRDSKMMRVLRPNFISPNSGIIFITNLSPTTLSFTETLNSMRFASRLKELKGALAGNTPSSSQYLVDDRVQKARQQLDEVAADVRIFLATNGQTSRLPRLRKTVVENLALKGVAAQTGVVRNALLVRPTCLKDAAQRCKDEWLAHQASHSAELTQLESKSIAESLLELRHQQQRQKDEERRAVEEANLHDTLRYFEDTVKGLQQETSMECERLDLQIKIEAEEGKRLSQQCDELSKRKRQLLHQLLESQQEEVEISQHITDATKQLAQTGAQLAEEELSSRDRLQSLDEQDKVLQAILAAQDTRFQLLRLRLENCSFEWQVQQSAREVAETLDPEPVPMELISKWVEEPINKVYSSLSVSRERHAVLDARLEWSSTSFQVSPLALYFQQSIPILPTRFHKQQKVTADGEGDLSSISSDEEVGAFLNEVESSPLRSQAVQEARAASLAPPSSLYPNDEAEMDEAAEFFLRNIALYGHLVRIFAAASRRFARRSSTPRNEFTEMEVQGTLIILDSVTIDERVVEAVVRIARAHRPERRRRNQQTTVRVQSSSSDATHPLAVHLSSDPVGSDSDPASENSTAQSEEVDASPDSSDSSTSVAMPKIISKATDNLLKILQEGIQGDIDSNVQLSARQKLFLPCVVRALQALSLVSVQQYFFASVTNKQEGGPTSVSLAVVAKIEQLRDSFLEGTASEDDKAVLDGIAAAARGGGLPRSRDRPRPRNRSSKASPHAIDAAALPEFLWRFQSRDLSVLRSFTVRALVDSGLISVPSRDASPRSDGNAAHLLHAEPPVPQRLFECLLLSLGV